MTRTRRKRKELRFEAWCWYCDREFEDEKVLLQHQKSKHYRCPQCPRRLNTAGGLAVHLTQVHKAQPDKIENTLTGRDSFEIEIYGMAGIPETDLAEWKQRCAAKKKDVDVDGGLIQNKRPRIEKVVFSTQQLRVQLEAHKALMSGKCLISSLGSAFGAPAAAFCFPPPSLPSSFGIPPPSFPTPSTTLPSSAYVATSPQTTTTPPPPSRQLE